MRPDIKHDEWSEEDIPTPTSSTVQALNGNVVVIFDWDDTLLASTAVRNNCWCPKQLKELEIAIESVLRTSMSLGETLIVTNGNGTWVEDSAQRFLPGLLPLLSQLRVVSARAMYEDMYPGDPFMWKHAAFEYLLTKERYFPAEPGLNLIAFGDQFPELDAARHVVQVVGGSSLVKTVKFREAPSTAELLGQLGKIKQILGKIVDENQCQSYGLLCRETSPFMDHYVSSASAWKCAREEECMQGCVDPMTGIKDILGLLV